MIERIVARCHVGDSLEEVTRYVISRFKHGFSSFQGMSTTDKGLFMATVIRAHNANRNLYKRVVSGRLTTY